MEELLEETKPKLPPAARGLHYLMAAPFRYGAPYPTGSRFRRAGRTDGVFYGAERPQTAAAEMAFHRLLFYANSPATPWPADAADFTAFNAPVANRAGARSYSPAVFRRPSRCGRILSPMGRARILPIRPGKPKADLIRYESVRDPDARRQSGGTVTARLCEPRA